MGKYASWSDFEKNAPKAYQDNATDEAYKTGMNGIAPSGMTLKKGRAEHYRSGVDGKGDDMVSGFKRAMFE